MLKLSSKSLACFGSSNRFTFLELNFEETVSKVNNPLFFFNRNISGIYVASLCAARSDILYQVVDFKGESVSIILGIQTGAQAFCS